MGFKKLEVAEDGGGRRRGTSRALAADLQVEVRIARIRRSGDARIAALHAKRVGEVHRAGAHRLELAEGAARGHHRLAHVLQQLAGANSRNCSVRMVCCASTKRNRRRVRSKRGAHKRTARVRAGGSESVNVLARSRLQVSHNDEMRTARLIPASTRRMSTRVHFILYT